MHDKPSRNSETRELLNKLFVRKVFRIYLRTTTHFLTKNIIKKFMSKGTIL